MIITKKWIGEDNMERVFLIEEKEGKIVRIAFKGKAKDFQNKMKGGEEDEL